MVLRSKWCKWCTLFASIVPIGGPILGQNFDDGEVTRRGGDVERRGAHPLRRAGIRAGLEQRVERLRMAPMGCIWGVYRVFIRGVLGVYMVYIHV